MLKRDRYLSPLRSAGRSLITLREEVAIALEEEASLSLQTFKNQSTSLKAS